MDECPAQSISVIPCQPSHSHTMPLQSFFQVQRGLSMIVFLGSGVACFVCSVLCVLTEYLSPYLARIQPIIGLHSEPRQEGIDVIYGRD